VLDYNSQDDLLAFLQLFPLEIAQERLAVYSFRGWPKFRLAHAKNMAHRLGIAEGGDILVNLDADNFSGERFSEFAGKMFAENPRAFLWAQMVKGEMARGVSGRIAVSPKAFTSVGGYDEKFTGWSSDDKDFNLRLRMTGFEPAQIKPEFLSAVGHNDKIRFKEYPHLMTSGDAEFAIEAASIKKAVVNDGKIGCGTVYRNFDRDDVVRINPIPTRVFGVGFPKTGTVSLHTAFGILGYESWHWSSAHIAKKIWQQMNHSDVSPTLERFEALCDLPIPLLYKKLDVAYPGSRFILTVRNEKKWLSSIRRHFMSEHNRWKAGWNNDPFTHRAHHLAYGRYDFDESTFLERYRSHNAEVQEYFRWRPQDLLILHLDKGAGWHNLCPFLDKPIPPSLFPHENRS
jgi:hypothetical protein